MDSYPMIKVKDSIQNNFEIIKHKSAYSLFDIDYYEVGFTNYYTKNTLFGLLLNIREYLTGAGTYKLIKDSYNKGKINNAFINRNMLAIKITNNYIKSGLWREISNKLNDFYNQYSTIENGVTKDNKKEFQLKRDLVVQNIWDDLSTHIDDHGLQLAFKGNYNNVTENLIDDYMEGIKLIQTMYLEKSTTQKKINKKNTKITTYNWNQNALSKYEIRTDKKIK
jgi:hypothetical protein